MATRKKKVGNGDDCVTVKGSHLTVATYKDGSTILTWDDEALLKDVRKAIEEYEMSKLKAAVKAKVATRKKKTEVLNSVEVSMEAIEKAKTSSKKGKKK